MRPRVHSLRASLYNTILSGFALPRVTMVHLALPVGEDLARRNAGAFHHSARDDRRPPGPTTQQKHENERDAKNTPRQPGQNNGKQNDK